MPKVEIAKYREKFHIKILKYALPVVIFCFIFSGINISSAVAADEPSEKEQLREILDATYQQIMENPTDVDLALRYTKVAVQLKDYEAAIPPLERILLFNPDLSRVKLELGILYYLLNSHYMANEYLAASKEDGASEEIVKRADIYLDKINNSQKGDKTGE